MHPNFKLLLRIAALFSLGLSAAVFAQASRTTIPLVEARGLLEPCQNPQTSLWGLCRADGSYAPPVVPQEFSFIGRGTTVFPARRHAGEALGYIDTEGAWRIPPQFDQAHAFSEGVGVVAKGGRSAALDPDGALVIPWFEGLLYPFHQGLACFIPSGRIELGWLGRWRQHWFGRPDDAPYPAPWWNIEGLVGFMDRQGRVVLKPQYQPRVNFLVGGCGFNSTGFAAMRQNGQDGLIDRQGRWVVPAEYEYLGLVFSGNRKVVAMVADRLVKPGWLLDTVERRDGFMGPDGAVQWRETGPPRESIVAGGLGRTLVNQMLFPRWQQDLTNEDVSVRMLTAWVTSLLVGTLAAWRVLLPSIQGAPGSSAWRWVGAALAGAVTLPVVFIVGLLSVAVSGLMLAVAGGACIRGLWARRRVSRPAHPASAP